MLKVKFQPLTITVPVIDNSGDHDCKMDEETYNLIHRAIAALPPSPEYTRPQMPRLSDYIGPRIIGGAPASPTQQNVWVSQADAEAAHIVKAWAGVNMPPRTPPLYHSQYQEPSQEDPKINTAVTDSEMRGGPEMSLEEFQRPVERTKVPPRPRRNSWRHEGE